MASSNNFYSTPNQVKTIYDRMAVAGNMVRSETIAIGNAPTRKFICEIEYENGLIVHWNGEKEGFKVHKNPLN